MKPNSPPNAAELRRLAEARLNQQQPTASNHPTEEQNARLLHELQVHQIELEMQNEELRKSQAQLEETAARYTDLYDFAPVAYITLGRAGTITQTNPPGASLLGLERTRLLGKPLSFFVDQADLAKLQIFLQQIFDGVRDLSCAVILANEVQPRRMVQIDATLSPDKQECRAVIVDITERKQAEAAWRKSEEHLTSLMHSVDGIVWEADAVTFQYTFVSPRAERLLGYPLARWIEEPTFWADHIHPEDRETAVRYCVSCTQANRDHEFEYRMLAADGRTIWLRDIVTVVSKNGQPVTLRGLTVDISARKQAETAIIEWQNRYHATINASGQLLYDWNPVTNAVTYAGASEQILGLALDEMAGGLAHWLALIHPDDRDAFNREIERVIASKTAFAQKYRVRRKDGSYAYAEDEGYFVLDAAGNITRMVGFVRDISARKHAESERDRLFNLSTDLICVANYEGYFTQVNPAWNRTLGWTATEMTSRPWLDFVHPEDHPASHNVGQELVDGQTVLHFENRYRHKDGSYRWLQWNAFPVTEAQTLFGIARDITEQKAAETAMRRSQMMLERTERIAHTGSWEWDIPTNLTTWSAELFCFFGRDPALGAPNLEGQKELYTPEDTQRLYAAVAQAIADGVPYDLELHRIGPTGEQRSYHALGYPERDASGKVVRLVGSLQDITERKQAEAARRKAADTQAVILNALPAHIALLDREGTILAVNESWRRFASANAARSQDFFVGQNYVRICELAAGNCAEESRQIATGLRELLAGSRSFLSIEYPCHSPQEKRWFRLMATPLYDDRTEGAVVMHVNITERKQAELALQASEARFSAFMQQSPVITFIKDEAGRFTYVTPTYERVFQTTAQAMQGKTVFEHFPPAVAQRLHEYDAAIFASGAQAETYQDVSTPAGMRHWLSIKFIFTNPEGARFLGGTAIDLTERLETEAALRESEARFRQLTENIEEVFWISDAITDNVLYVSPAYEKIWSRTCRSLYDSPSTWIETVYPEDRERVREARSKQQLGTYDEEYRIIRPDGTLRWIHDKAFSVRDEAGTVTRIVGVAEDITAHRELEAQFRQAQKMEAIGTLAGGIAHDFNNILAAVKGYTQLAKADAADRPDLQEHLDAVLQGTHRAADLVRQIITFSRQHGTQHRPVRLQTIVTEALNLLRATIPTTVEIKTVMENNASLVMADPTQIHQVLVNLCTNAWHAMQSRSGRLEVHVEKIHVEAEFVHTHQELKAGPHIRLTVADTGCGMDQATLVRVFEPFFTTKGPGEGSGLGLAVVHGIMQSHHGAIIIHSKLNQGTTFQLYFPEYAGTEIEQKTSTLSRSPQGNHERILLVDDEPPLVRLGTIILERAGYVVSAFTSSKAALAALRANPNDFDLVISDLAMPEMSGLDFAQEIRHLRPDLPIILDSGYIDKDTKEVIKGLGILQVLLKPFTVESLSQAVHQVLAGQR